MSPASLVTFEKYRVERSQLCGGNHNNSSSILWRQQLTLPTNLLECAKHYSIQDPEDLFNVVGVHGILSRSKARFEEKQESVTAPGRCAELRIHLLRCLDPVRIRQKLSRYSDTDTNLYKKYGQYILQERFKQQLALNTLASLKLSSVQTEK